MNSRGVNNLVVIVLIIVFVVAMASFIFTWVKKTATETSEKSADKVSAQDVCNDKVKISVNNIVDKGNSLDIHLENMKSCPVSDFVIRMENGDNAEVKKVRQLLGTYESIVLNVPKPNGFLPKLIKVIPRIVLTNPDISTVGEGWWICSKQLSTYEMF